MYGQPVTSGVKCLLNHCDNVRTGDYQNLISVIVELIEVRTYLVWKRIFLMLQM